MGGNTTDNAAALRRWREKLAYLRDQLALADSAASKFKIENEIEEAEAWITQLSNAPADATARCHNLPFASLGASFQGRQDHLERLRTADENAQVLVQKHTLHGLGGIGKTRLAVEYAWHSEERYARRFFVTADAPSSLNRGLAALAGPGLLNLPEHEKEDAAVEAVLGWLRANGSWLLILDNVDEREAVLAVQEVLPRLEGSAQADCRVLITSRRSKWRKGIRRLELDVLDEDAAVRLLMDGNEDDDAERALELARELGCFPLALEQAAAFVDRHEIRFAEYLESWRKERESVLDWHDEELMGYPASVATTWQKSFDQLGTRSRAVLRLLAHLSTEPVATEMFDNAEDVDEAVQALVEENGMDADERPMREVWAELLGYSLVKKEDAFVRVHRLVQEVVRGRIPEERRKEWVERAVHVVGGFAPRPSDDVRTWPVWDPLRPHAARVIALAERMDSGAAASSLMNNLSLLLKTKGLYDEAEPLIRRSLEIVEETFGGEHPDVAIRLNNLAALLLDVNRLEEAEPLMRRALEIAEKALGSEHPNVTAQLNNLAQLLQATNRLEEAEPLMRRALKIDEKEFGPEHPNAARNLNNLAQLLQDTNRLKKAEPLMRRALKIDEEAFGSEHPRVAVQLNNLAHLLQDTNRLKEAEPLMRRALKIDEEAFGSEHLDVAIDLNNLAHLLKDTNRLEEAKPLMRRALEIFESSYGNDHPRTQLVRRNLESMCGKGGKEEAASDDDASVESNGTDVRDA